MKFGWKERKEHYTAVASGTTPVKSGSKFSADEQKAYARGIRDEMNRNSRIFAFKNATDKQRAQYAATRAAKRAAYLAKKAK